MATAFSFYKPQDVDAMRTQQKSYTQQAQDTNPQIDAIDRQIASLQSQVKRPSMFSPFGTSKAVQDQLSALESQRSSLFNANVNATKQASNLKSQGDVAEATNRMYGMTAGISDQLMNDPQVAAALSQLQAGMQSGPYTERVQQQLINRNADQSAAAEAVNAQDARDLAAARGLDATQALRQGQQQRQQQNIAFSGDLLTRATLENYTAQQNAAKALAAARLSQYGAAQPGYSQAANYAAQTQFTQPRTSAVQPGGAPRIAFSGNQGGGQAPTPSPAPSPSPSVAPITATGAANAKPLSVADRNAKQAAWLASGGRTINGTVSGAAVAQQSAPQMFGTPATYGSTPFGPVSTAQNARSYQNIYKYTR